MLDQLSRSTFAEFVGSMFRMEIDGERAVDVELIECTSLASTGPKRGEANREPFSLIFRAPLEVRVPQRIYRISREKIPAIDIFLVPIGPDERGMRYEAIFT
jgi:hypothetical protein